MALEMETELTSNSRITWKWLVGEVRDQEDECSNLPSIADRK